MKLGVISANLMNYEFEDGLRHARELGLQAIETGGIGLWEPSGVRYCPVDKLLADRGEIRRWLETHERYGLEISALGAHGAPLIPDKDGAQKYSEDFRKQCKLAELAGISRMTLLAGLPEGAEGDTAPNWVAFAEWPVLRDTLEWQWEKRLLPYWREHGKIAADHGVTLCFEMHGGDMIHNPVKVKRLHDEIGPVVACNFDIAHMWYQRIDPVEAARFLGPLIQHVHVKDTLIHEHNARVRGLMDTTSTEEPENRAWNYTVCGWGHGEDVWREWITTLRLVGYDHALSIEMESEFFEVEEGLRKSVEFLKPLVLEKPPGARWWEIAGMERAGGLGKTGAEVERVDSSS